MRAAAHGSQKPTFSTPHIGHTGMTVSAIVCVQPSHTNTRRVVLSSGHGHTGHAASDMTTGTSLQMATATSPQTIHFLTTSVDRCAPHPRQQSVTCSPARRLHATMSAYSFSFAGATSACGPRWEKATSIGAGTATLPLIRRSGNVDVEASLALIARCAFDADGALTRMCPTLIVAITSGVGCAVLDVLLARAGKRRKQPTRRKGVKLPCTSVFHSATTDSASTTASRANNMCKACFHYTLCAERAAWPRTRDLANRVTEPAASAFCALATPGCRAKIVSAAAGPHDLCYALVMHKMPSADAWRALPCANTINRIRRSRAKDDICNVLTEVVEIGWAPLVSARPLFSGPDLYQCQNVLLLGSMVAVCRTTVVVHTAAVTGTGPVDQMTWAELQRAVAGGVVHGCNDNAAPPFQMLVAAAACFVNVTLCGPGNDYTVPPALIKTVCG